MTSNPTDTRPADACTDSSEIPIKLTAREQEVLLWCAHAKSSWEIGRILDCKESTVNFHIANILRKFNVSSRIAAVIKALRYGMLQHL
ncbi:helix-turn-helix transcriptional regulator [Pseudomonas alkylphenolica]|uniref:Helix-turn-helix transcriptional regulator n=1 Tax=Pseudomonas alkylphenolica TaxID=237609 RepID=A0A443ZPJ6_9PSED|nr:LuxR family transcriptional regulator [Pseudomonas alkylphenolica]RWU21031.1 helix-turn-helix transcriptional regulator [Pseudomonas alkylphenolica]